MNVKEFKKIALVGATPNPTKYGNIILRDLLGKGFEVLPVNPKYEEIENVKCYKTVRDLPKDVDVIVFVVPPKIGLQIAKDAVEAGFRKLWFQPGAESEEIKKFLEDQNVEYSFKKCIMVETGEKRMFLEV
ncbi:CoA-binding protein [Thermococcus sp. EP1]|uniref:CoA-binding protein n=1 Tax=Thermococcus sp. EP1 TaxID=1591054 RepID=UPI0006DBC686|nr:CoA-binding protein [Thermococcus sp. EP1]KPU62750.1 CoA-binding protein [Thermococcus sp. EP1]